MSVDLKTIHSCNFPRYIGLNQEENTCIDYQLLVFCDASKYAYAAAVYLFQQTTKFSKVDHVFAKNKAGTTKQARNDPKTRVISSSHWDKIFKIRTERTQVSCQ